MIEWAAFSGILAASLLLLRRAHPAGFIQGCLTLFVLVVAHLVSIGYIASALGQLGNLALWASLAWALTVIYLTVLQAGSKLPGPTQIRISIQAWLQAQTLWFKYKTNGYEKFILACLFLSMALTGLLNLLLVFLVAPNHEDGLTYHLARMAYYLQQNHLGFYDANYWAQVTHPQNGTLLLVFSYLASGQKESLTQLPQYISYWTSILAIYAIARNTGSSKTQALFSAGCASLITVWLMQSTTTQNDLVITALIGISLNGILLYQSNQQKSSLLVSAACLGLALGVKSSAAIPAALLGLTAIYALGQKGKSWKPLFTWLGLCAVSFFFFTLPAGYADNLFRYHSPMGPTFVVKAHTFSDKSPRFIFIQGSKNVVRYGFEFLSLDGFPPVQPVMSIQQNLRAVPSGLANLLELNLEGRTATRAPFRLDKQPVTHEDLSYFGIIGFMLVWPTVAVNLFKRDTPPEKRILAITAVLFVIGQAYAGPYDPWRGRYFTVSAIFSAPLLGAWLSSTSRLVRGCLAAIIVAGCFSAVCAVLLRSNSPLVSINHPQLQLTSVFEMSRVEQLTRNRPQFTQALANYENSVPPGATVAVHFRGDTFEYPLFGKGLTRKLLPVNGFWGGARPIPPEADYLIYQTGYPCTLDTDVHLGANWYLRKLTADHRARSCK